MNMPKDMPQQGVTFERMQHSEIIVEVRTITKGGMIASYGNRDLDHCVLDWAYRTGHLGKEPDAAERYSQGYRLRELWYSFNPTGTALEDMGNHKSQFVSEGEIGKGIDARESEYHAVMKALPEKYRPGVKYLCIEDYWPGIRQAQECLDALYGAFYRIDSKKI